MDQPPMAFQSQASIAVDNPLGPYTIGSYHMRTAQVQPSSRMSQTTSLHGTVPAVTLRSRLTLRCKDRRVLTTNWTKAQKYTSGRPNANVYKSDEVDVN